MNFSSPQASYIIAFYNRVDYLRLVLAALEQQSHSDFEVVVADDGSGEEEVKAVQELIVNSPLQINHVWHEDQGFRKTRALNLGVCASRSDYLIFSDTDCIPHPDFIAGHVHNKFRGTILEGRRVHLSRKLTASLTLEKVRDGYLQTLALYIDGIFGETKGTKKAICLHSPFIRSLVNRKSRGLVGSNFSLHRDDLLSVNGFDERYQAPAIGEDSDLQFRLEQQGMVLRNVHNSAVQYHLHHEPLSRTNSNDALFERVKKLSEIVTSHGIAQHSAATRLGIFPNGRVVSALGN